MKHRLRSERGTLTAEFALILPTLLLFLMGIIEVGRVFNAWIILTNDTREAARYGVAAVRDQDANLTSEVQSYAQSTIGQLLDPSALTVTVVPQSDGSSTTSVTVIATYQMPILTPLIQTVIGNTVPISVESVMRAE